MMVATLNFIEIDHSLAMVSAHCLARSYILLKTLVS